MRPWLNSAAKRIADQVGDDAAGYAVDDDDVERLLALAGVAAHDSGDRTNAPLVDLSRRARARTSSGQLAGGHRRRRLGDVAVTSREIIAIAHEQVLERASDSTEAQTLRGDAPRRRRRCRRCWSARTRCACAGVGPRSRSRGSSRSRPAAARRTATSARSRGGSRPSVRAVRLDIPSLVPCGAGNRRHRRDRVLHRRRRPRPGRAPDGAGCRCRRRDQRCGRDQRLLLARDPHPRAGRAAPGSRRPPLQPQPRNRPLVLPAGRDDPHVGRAPADARARA